MVRNNYDVDEFYDNKNLNTYNQTYEKAKQYINSKHRVDKIYQYLIHNLNNKKCLATLAETLVASSLYKLKLLRHNFIGLFYDPKKSGVDFLVRNIDKIIFLYT